MFGELVDRISPRTEKQDTNLREALKPGLKLAVTLRHLATGASYAELMYSFRVAKNTISLFVPKVLEAVIQEYSEEVLPAVVTLSSGSRLPMPGDDKNIPYFLTGDDVFPRSTWMMKPYSRRNLTDEERIFNYRLSRARRVVENAFGILAMRFQCLLGCLNQSPETVNSIILACVTLHNLHRIRYPAIARQTIDHEDGHNQLQPGEWCQERQMTDDDNAHGKNVVTSAGVRQRDYLNHYFNSPAGSVDWQQNMFS